VPGEALPRRRSRLPVPGPGSLRYPDRVVPRLTIRAAAHRKPNPAGTHPSERQAQRTPLASIGVAHTWVICTLGSSPPGAPEQPECLGLPARLEPGDQVAEPLGAADPGRVHERGQPQPLRGLGQPGRPQPGGVQPRQDMQTVICPESAGAPGARSRDGDDRGMKAFPQRPARSQPGNSTTGGKAMTARNDQMTSFTYTTYIHLYLHDVHPRHARAGLAGPHRPCRHEALLAAP
jgi:hypothetical protein